ncbi:MAG: hypothetical protein AAFR16_13640, partial [Pseudomonadota bacterium]
RLVDDLVDADAGLGLHLQQIQVGAALHRFLLKVKTKAGICVDQIIDKTTGRVVEETENTPCSCET